MTSQADKSWGFPSFDGVSLKIHEMGQGRPILLLHGLFSSAQLNWIKFGHAQKLAENGFRVVMPDFRAHGQSAAPHDPAAYPEDVLMADIMALLDHFGWDDFDLGGFSLGARTAAKLLCNGIKPRRAILAGMGWEGLQGWSDRQQFFVDAINMRDSVTREDPHFMAVQFFKSQKIDPEAALLMLGSFGAMNVNDLLAVDLPIGVICGRDDHDNGSATLLAEKLADAQYFEIPGSHMSSVTQGALGDAMLDFLTGDVFT
jgi:pimeloyl-ACP methyl ester carboxylesterase